MNPTEKPRLPLPEPLRGAELGTFTHTSIVERLPEIGRRTIAENNFDKNVNSNIDALIQEIPYEQIRPLNDPNAPDRDGWANYVVDYIGQNWLDVPWFFAETYFYRRVLEASGYFLTGPGYGVDPFSNQKRQGLETMQMAIEALGDQAEELFEADFRSSPRMAKMLAKLVAIDLWGNQVDLSMWPAGHKKNPRHRSEDQQREHTLVDNRPEVIDHLTGRDGLAARVDFILDNAGFELVADLLLAAFLLHQELASTVVMHTKVHPTFVSDAMIKDVEQTITYLTVHNHPGVSRIGHALQTYLDGGRLRLSQHEFWTSPLAMWDMPPSLKGELDRADLLISKGDANYRRLLGDRHWLFTTPFKDIVSYLPAPLLALRTLKSEVVTGLTHGQLEAVASSDPNWLVNGRWGLIQFSH